MREIAVDQGALPGDARRAVGRECRRASTGPECEASAVLLTSEVVTNALLHGSGDVTLAVGIGDLAVRVEVGDGSPHHPGTATAPAIGPAELAEGGRGLTIVDVLSSAWGASTRGGGKTVWFEVPTQP